MFISGRQVRKMKKKRWTVALKKTLKRGSVTKFVKTSGRLSDITEDREGWKELVVLTESSWTMKT